MAVGRSKGDGWRAFLPLDLWERKGEKEVALVIWFCSEILCCPWGQILWPPNSAPPSSPSPAKAPQNWSFA